MDNSRESGDSRESVNRFAANRAIKGEEHLQGFSDQECVGAHDLDPSGIDKLGILRMNEF